MADWRMAHVQGKCPVEHVQKFIELTGHVASRWSGEEHDEENERRRIAGEQPLWLTILANDTPFGLGGPLALAERCTVDGNILDAGLLNEKGPEREHLEQELVLLGHLCPGLHLVVHVSHIVSQYDEGTTAVEYCLELLPTGVVHEVRASLAVISGTTAAARYQYMLVMFGLMREPRHKLVPSREYAAWYFKEQAEVYNWYLVDCATGEFYDQHGKQYKAE